jgi:hypothetical protein
MTTYLSSSATENLANLRIWGVCLGAVPRGLPNTRPRRECRGGFERAAQTGEVTYLKPHN